MIPVDQNTLRNPDDILKESMERIYQLLEEKKYFMVKDELLKFNDADIAEMFEELLEDPDDIEKSSSSTDSCRKMFRLRFFPTFRPTTSSKSLTA